jgi:hypothetical protein
VNRHGKTEPACLSHAANVRKEIIELFDVWLEETSSALLARWLMEHRDRMAHGAMSSFIGEKFSV